MTPWAIIDTGPLVACLDRGDGRHAWAKEQIRRLEAPLLTCEPVLSETLFLLAGAPAAKDAVLGMLEEGLLRLDFRLADHLAEIRALCAKYRDRRISLADACLLRMAEINDRHAVFTLDSDFRIYRKRGRAPLALISP